MTMSDFAAQMVTEQKMITEDAAEGDPGVYHAVALDFLRALRVHQCTESGVTPSVSGESESESDLEMDLPGQRKALALLKAHDTAERAARAPGWDGRRAVADARSVSSCHSAALSRSSRTNSRCSD